MFRFLLRRPIPLRVRSSPLARTTALATLALSSGALAIYAHSQSDPDQPPLSDLLRAYLVFGLCSFPPLVDASPRIISFLSSVPVLRDVSDAFLRVTFFNQFVGAETIDGCIPLLHKLRKSNQGALIAYSVERPHEPSEPPSQAAVYSILHSIDCAANFEDSLSPSNSPPTGSTWVAFKLSTLLPDPNALRVLSDWIVHHTSTPPPIPFPSAPDSRHLQHFLQPNDDHATTAQQHVQSLYTNLRKICTRAQSRGVRLMIDAEETWFQPAIDLFSVLLMQEFNSRAVIPQPLVYTTLQAYLIRTPALLDFLIQHASDNDYALGVKLVRGAYIDAEVHAHASQEAISISPDENPPTHPDKASTDAAYDHCVRTLVAEVARDVERAHVQSETTSTPRIAVLFGTHNWRSCRLLLDEILRVGLGQVVDTTTGVETETRKQAEKKISLSEHVRQRVSIAQLYGMSDSLAAYLVDRTFHPNPNQHNQPLPPFVIRCVPYGPLRDVMPYLARRAVENRSVLGSSASSSGHNELGLTGDGSGEEERGRAVAERKRMGRLIRERVLGFWRF